MLFVRGILQTWLKKHLTRKLNESSNLQGGFGEIELRLFRGVAVLRGVHIVRLSEGRRVVEAHCPEISIHIQWRELLHRTLVGRVTLREPKIEICADRESDHDGKPQTDALLALCRETQRFMPFYLRSLELSEGSIAYVSQLKSAPFKVTLDRVSLSATGLTNIARPTVATKAHVFVQGRATGDGKFWMRLTLPSLSETLTFDLQAGLNRLNLVDWNDVLRAYAGFDLKRGVCSIYAQFNVERGRYQGFIEPRFQDLDVFAWEKDHGKGFLQICRQVGIAFLAKIFKNKPHDELALNIPITGSFAEADVDIWAAIGSLLKNAFVHSLLPRSPNIDPGTETIRCSFQPMRERRPS